MWDLRSADWRTSLSRLASSAIASALAPPEPAKPWWRGGWGHDRRPAAPTGAYGHLARWLPVVTAAAGRALARRHATPATPSVLSERQPSVPVRSSTGPATSTAGAAAAGVATLAAAGAAFVATEAVLRHMASIARRYPQPIRAAEQPTTQAAALPAHASSKRRADHRPGVREARAAEPGRGRAAQAPHHIPWAGWKDIFWRVYDDINDNRLLAVAAGVTFYTLLAVFPAVAAMVSLYGLFADPAAINDNMAGLLSIMPSGGVEIVSDQIKRLTAQPSGALSFGLILSLGISLWSANAAMKAIFDALNVVYEETEKRSFVMLNLQTLGCTLGALVAVNVALAAIIVSPIIFAYTGLNSWSSIIIAVLRWPVMLAVVLTALAVLYRVGPSRDYARWRWLSVGSVVAAVGWLIVSIGFSWYVSNFGSYNKTYGSLGAAVGFMTWIWLSGFVILVGAELNAEIEHQTAEDTTVGAPRPMGQRRAEMADTVGKAR